ncbi:probable ion channel POLLUX isoform X3 [Triticum dicoccoides]|uniref:probable ion channel POLLUX isoform X3 n=1 Tax=Triticum dicoccoides TaxID=85692 RepID=UPI00188E6B82|nr:probable ion channel POLLUX isoform X3 [Triticum dicoccoides]
MAESDGGEADPGAGRAAGGGDDPAPRAQRPQLAKSRTIAGSAAAAASAEIRRGGRDGGILARRSTTAAAAPLQQVPRRLTVAVDDPSHAAPNAGVLDRDWCYPSFLGPHASRPRPPRQQQTPPPAVAAAPARRNPSGNPATTRRVAASQRDEEKSLASVVKQSALLGERRPLSPPPPPPRARRFDLSPYCLLLLLVVTVTSSSLAFWQWMKVLGLQKKVRSCSGGADAADSEETAETSWVLGDPGSGFVSSESWKLAPMLALAIPLFLFKYADQLRRKKENSSRTRSTEEEVPLEKRIAYKVDVFFSGHPYAKLLALLIATVVLIASGGIALYSVSGSGFLEALWLSWTFVADSGNHADQVGLGPRIVSVSISAGGMLVFATMLGLVSDAISEKVDSWRKGKSEVIEVNHILILGWSDKLGSLLKQLAIANKSIGGGVVVVLAERDKEEMEMDIGKLGFDFMGTSVICRSGSPLILADLKKIWEDILGFENAEFYIKRWPELDGMRFGDVLISFPDAVPCGVKLASRFGSILMNPDDDYVLREGDEILVIAEDDDTYAPAPLPEVHKGFLPNVPTPPKYPEKILFCGWRRDIHDMIMVLEAFLAPGSELWMFNEVPEKARETKLTDGGMDILGLTNIKLVHKEGNAVIRRHLESLPLETFDSILILADESVEDSIVQSDSRSLATLLLIRDVQSKRLPSKESKSPLHHNGFSHSSWIRKMQHASDKSIIISEILDSRTRNLVSVSKISDYVLSNELVSMALAMVAEDKQINRVLEELFAEEGNEMCIRSAEFYLYEQEELSFLDIMVRARERDEIVIGYRLANTDEAIINPEHKSEIKKWSLDDVFVVIAKADREDNRAKHM